MSIIIVNMNCKINKIENLIINHKTFFNSSNSYYF